MTRLPRITAKEMIGALKRAGWVEERRRGSHVQMKHPSLPGCVTVPAHAGATLKPKVVSWILDQAGLTAEDLRPLL